MKKKDLPNPENVLSEWRTKILNLVLIIITAATLPAWLLTLINSLNNPVLVPSAIAYSILFAFTICLSLFRKIPYHLRAWGVVILGYAAAIVSLNLTGLKGSGPLYLITISVFGFILINLRAGINSTVISILLAGFFNYLISMGIIEIHMDEIGYLWPEFFTFTTLSVVVTGLLVLYYRFQSNLIQAERESQTQLSQAQELLRKQNLTLEQKVQERTSKLEQINKIQTALFEIADATSSSSDMDRFFIRTHEIISGLMYAGNFLVALYDTSSRMVTFPCFINNEGKSIEPIPLRKCKYPAGYIIKSGKPIKHGRKELKNLIKEKKIQIPETNSREIIGAPLKIKSKTFGAIVLQSDPEVYQYSSQDDEILAYISSQLSTALVRIQALEAERQRTAELTILNSIADTIVKTLDINSLIRIIGDKVLETFKCDGTLILLLDEKTNLIHVPYHYDISEGGHLDSIEPFPLGIGLSSKVINSGQPLLLKTLEEAIANEAYFPLGTNEIEKTDISWLGVPIKFKDRVLGLIALESAKPYAFDQKHLNLLETLSSNIGIAIENTRLYEAEQQRASELTILNSIADSIVKTLDISSLIRIIGDKILEIFKCESTLIMLLDEKTNLIHVPYEYDGAEGGYIENVEPFPLGTGVSSKVINSGEPLLLSTLEEEIAHGAYFPPEIIEGGTGAYSQSWLGVPIKLKNKVLGLIALADTKPYAFDQKHLNLLQTLSSNIGIAIENARLYEAEQQRAEELAAINEVSTALVSEIEIEALVNLVGEKMLEVFDADIAYVALLDERENLIRFPFTHGEDTTPIPFGVGLASKVLLSNHPLVINEKTDGREEVIIGKQSISYLGVPIHIAGKAIGVLSVQNTEKENVFSETDTRLLTIIASNVSKALQNARLFTDLKNRKEFSESLIATNPTAIVIFNKENQVTSWNPAAEKLFGYRTEEAAGKTIVDLVSDNNNRDQVVEFSRDVGSGKTVHAFVDRVGKDGQKLNLELFAVPVTFENNEAGTFVIYHDITEIKRAEAAIIESQRRLTDIIDFLPDATLVIDHKGRVIAWNRAIEEMTGIPAEEMLGKSHYEYALPFYGQRRPILIDLVLLPQEEFEEKNYVQIQRDGEALTGETYTPNLKGGARYLYAKATPLRDGEGQIIGAIETIRDITDRKKAEEELQQAKEVADTANQAKSAFLANMSHELRTPLNAIIGFTRIVRKKAEGTLPEKQIENLEKVLVSSDQLLSLINTVLDIAKIEAGRMDVLPANFRIGALIDLCYNTTQPLIQPNVIFEKMADEQLATIYSDQDKIRQIVLNLLSNAAKFTHHGKITLEARQSGEDLHIAVTDTGIGISEEALTRIFKEFQQAESGTTREYGGTGLGLSISRKLAHLLGGDITVKSELGKGSVFTLILPKQFRSTSSIDAPRDEEITKPGDAEKDNKNIPRKILNGRKKKILVIDDDADTVYLLKENLQGDFYDIRSADNGEEGIKAASEYQPDVIFLDVVMPGINGWQVLHSLKSDPITAPIPVVFLTVLDNKALGMELGAFDYLLKPLNARELEKTLLRILGKEIEDRVCLQIIDDDPNMVEILRQSLPDTHFSIQSALDPKTGLAMIKDDPPDVLLLDIIMPEMDGFEVIEILKQDEKLKSLPIIVVSAKDLNQKECEQLNQSLIKVMRKQGLLVEELINEIFEILDAVSDGKSVRENN